MASANKYDYKISITNEIVDSRTATNKLASTNNPPTVTQSNKTPNPNETPETKASSGRSIMAAISAQFLVEAGSKLLNATGNGEIAQTVSTVGRYTFLGARALGGDPTAIATLAIDIAAQALREAQKQAQKQNEIDIARANAGLIDLSGVKITKDFFTGRYQYNRG